MVSRYGAMADTVDTNRSLSFGPWTQYQPLISGLCQPLCIYGTFHNKKASLGCICSIPVAHRHLPNIHGIRLCTCDQHCSNRPNIRGCLLRSVMYLKIQVQARIFFPTLPNPPPSSYHLQHSNRYENIPMCLLISVVFNIHTVHIGSATTVQ